MVKIFCSFVAGIIFTVFVFIFLSHWGTWFFKEEAVKAHTVFSPITTTNDRIFVASTTFGGNEPSFGYIHALDMGSHKEAWTLKIIN